MCSECGETYSMPLLATLTSEGASQEYYACPRCLTKVGEVKTQQKEETTETSPINPKQSEATLDSSTGCQHSLGFLKKRPKNMAIPDECLTCGKMVECLYLQ